jgi:CheY-like chemotaxis protein
VEFQQLESAAAKRYQGTGLGLALTKRMIEAQGGTVGVTSVPGQGSTFFAVLPRVGAGAVPEEPEAVTAAPAPLLSNDGSPAVLVIEDDAADRAWLCETLTQAGYAVKAAANGAEAMALCREQTFEAITLDLLLPDMHGWDVLRSIRSEAMNGSVPVIVVTVVADRSSAAGFAIQDFLSKPLRAEELLASLERVGVNPGGSRCVLVVDDDPTALKLMETTLGQLGYPACCVSSAQEGLRTAPESRPAAVVLDLLMPGMDGFEFLDRFRRTGTGRRTPVIVWTNKDLSLHEQERLHASAQAVVLKSRGGTALLLEALEAHLPPAKEHPVGG